MEELQAQIRALEAKSDPEIILSERKKLQKKLAGNMDKTPESLKATNSDRLQKFMQEKQNVLDDVMKRFDSYFNLV